MKIFRATRFCSSLFILVAAGLLSVVQAKPPASKYAITDLGKLTEAAAINDSGQVAGTITFPSTTGNPTDASHSHAFLYSQGYAHDLGTLGGQSSVARGINQSGEVVGFSRVVQPDRKWEPVHAFLYSNGSMRDLWAPSQKQPNGFTWANGINVAGQIAGKLSDQACLYAEGKILALGSFVEGGYSEARRINRSGQIIGSAKAGDGRTHAFLFSNGKMQDLGTLGGASSQAEDLNDFGQVVGAARAPDGHGHAFLYQNGKMNDLGIPPGFEDGAASGINVEGEIVGSGSKYIGASKEPLGPIYMEGHAFCYRDGKWMDLNSLVDLSGTGLRVLYDATAINSSGQIIGKAMASDSYHAYVLTPRPP